MKKKPAAGFSDTLKIDFPAAVFYSPDSVQLKKIMSAADTKTTEAVMHEYYNLVRNARLVIKRDQPKLTVIDAKNVRYLFFIEAAKNDCIDLDTKNDPFGLLIFDGIKQPVLVDMANIETDLGFYFAK